MILQSLAHQSAWVDAWVFDLGLQGKTLQQLADSRKMLDASEVERSSKLASRALANAFVASRAALRLTLLNYGCGVNGALAVGSSGKPLPIGGIHFSLSRSGEAVVVAVSNAEVGVDIERTRAMNVTEPVFAAIDAQLRQAHRSAALPHHPIRTWTVMEAWVKYHGHSMRTLLDQSELWSRLRDDISLSRVDLVALALPGDLCGTVCIQNGATLTYESGSRLLANGKRSAPPAVADRVGVRDERCGVP